MVRIGHADVRLRDLKYIGGYEAVRSLRLKFQAALDLLPFGRYERLTGEGRSADRKKRGRIARVRRESALAEICQTGATGELARGLLDMRFEDALVGGDVRRVVTPGERDHPSRSDLHVVLEVEAQQRDRLPNVGVREQIRNLPPIDGMKDVNRRRYGEPADIGRARFRVVDAEQHGVIHHPRLCSHRRVRVHGEETEIERVAEPESVERARVILKPTPEHSVALELDARITQRVAHRPRLTETMLEEAAARPLGAVEKVVTRFAYECVARDFS